MYLILVGSLDDVLFASYLFVSICNLICLLSLEFKSLVRSSTSSQDIIHSYVVYLRRCGLTSASQFTASQITYSNVFSDIKVFLD
jgi:hypothetical protein